MKAKMMKSAKMHYEQLMQVLEQMGMSMEAFMDTMEDEAEMLPEMMGKEEEEDEDDNKIAMLLAKVDEEEEEA